MFDALEKRVRGRVLARIAAAFGAEAKGDRVIVRAGRDDARLRWLGRLWR